MNLKNKIYIGMIAISLIISLLITASSSLKLFLIGGACNENSTLVFGQLASTIPSRPPQPNLCDQDWDTTICPRIAVVTSAAENEAAGNDAYSNDSESLSYKTMFLRYGLAPKHLTIHRDNYKVHGNILTPEGKANLEILQQADIIFYNGGDQSRHLRAWLNDDGSPNGLLVVVKSRALENQVVLAGTSAGSMIWSPVTMGGGDSFGTLYFKNSIGLAPKKITDADTGGSGFDDNRNGNKSLQFDHNGGKMTAFGMINFFADTHFNARGRLGRLPPVLVDIKLNLGVGIDQQTVFYYQDGVGQVYGYNGVTICDLQNTLVKPMTYFTANAIRTHYLTSGDRYDFNSKIVTSNKSKITSPAYSGPTDSHDILYAYEATLLETREVDQKSLYNLGHTRTPSDFPKSTPIFELKFYRDQQTVGYYGQKKYTVSNLLVDFSFGANLQQETE